MNGALGGKRGIDMSCIIGAIPMFIWPIPIIICACAGETIMGIVTGTGTPYAGIIGTGGTGGIG